MQEEAKARPAHPMTPPNPVLFIHLKRRPLPSRDPFAPGSGWAAFPAGSTKIDLRVCCPGGTLH